MNTENAEIWKPIEGFENYQVSTSGRVKSLPRRGTIGGILKPEITNDGYLQVALYNNGKRYWKRVHRLVAQTFLPNPNNLPEVNHKDENPSNSNLQNLEWCTTSYNHDYGTRIERVRQATTNGKCSKTVLQFDINGNFIAEYPSTQEVQRQLGFRQGFISTCCLNKCKSAYGFIWRYK